MKPIQRRAFIRNSAAAVAATTATAATGTAPATTATASSQLSGGNSAPARDQREIQQLHHAFVAQLNSGEHRGLDPLFAREVPKHTDRTPVYILGHSQHLDAISIALDQQHATARFHCLARLEAALYGSAPVSLLEMAHQQGQGVIQRWESGVLESEYVKLISLWKIARISFVPTASSETLPLQLLNRP